MKNRIFYKVGLIILGILVFSVGPAGARWDGRVDDCSWGKKIDSYNRFIILPNWDHEAVLDRETCLVWEREVHGEEDWWDANWECMDSNAGGRKGWRLPTIQELQSLIDPNRSDPALPANNPFDVSCCDYWSATGIDDDSDYAVIMDLSTGEVDDDEKEASNLVWCVRGGHGVDIQ